MASIFSKVEEEVNVSSFEDIKKTLSNEELFFARGELNRVCTNKEYLIPEVILAYKLAIAQSIIARRF